MKPVTQLLMLVAVCVAACGQDPLRTLPKNYQLALENDLVRVIRVHYDAHEKLPVHDHPKTPIIYVYLSDAGPVRFKHKGDEPYDLQRPAVKKGGFRMHRGFIEMHEVENIGDTPSDFLRVELKTLPIGTPGLSGRFPPPTDYSRSTTKVEFENANVRIVRVVCAAQGECGVAGPPGPALEVVFSDSPEKSQVRWVSEGSRAENDGATATHLLRIEVKKRA
jgi:hypothetical protein